ncbi:MAG: hypothetical protein IIA60_07380 [Candidatus Marinimicrobia bacterium]|nr:hypothetical protein [Candidatus Neomarinimicrobiota bacterium]
MTSPREIPPEELGRKLIHLASSLIPLGYWLAGRDSTIIVLGVLTIGLLSAEVLRTSTAWGRRYYRLIFGAMTRSSEAERFTGASFVFLGALSAVVLFPATVAILAMLFMTLGDSAAALVGMRYGRLRLGHKTLEGTAACFVVCLGLALAGGLPGSVALTGAATAALTELVPWGIINDNVAIPLFAGGVMTLMMAAPL